MDQPPRVCIEIADQDDWSRKTYELSGAKSDELHVELDALVRRLHPHVSGGLEHGYRLDGRELRARVVVPSQGSTAALQPTLFAT